MSRPVKISRNYFISIGIWVAAAAAVVISWAGWTGLAEMAGWVQFLHVHYLWGGIDLRLSWAFGIAVDWFAFIAGSIWKTAHWATPKTRNAARAWTFVAMVMGMLANATFLVLEWMKAPPAVAVIVLLGSVPPFMAWVAIHLAVRYGDDLRQALADEGVATLVHEETRGSWLLRTVGATRDLVKLIKEPLDEPVPAGQEDRGVSPAQPVSLAKPVAKPAVRPERPRRLSVVSGDSIRERMRSYYLAEREAGWPATEGAPLNGAGLDRVFGTNNYGRSVVAKIKIAEEGEELSS